MKLVSFYFIKFKFFFFFITKKKEIKLNLKTEIFILQHI